MARQATQSSQKKAPPARTIMVVDDDRISLKQISATLKRGGYHVITADDGEAALYRIPGLYIDLIVLDSIMPRMDGPEVLRHLKDKDGTAAIPVMMLTGKTQRASDEEAVELGAEDYIAKPVDPKLLLERVAKLLEKTEDRLAVEDLGTAAKGKNKGAGAIQSAQRVHLDLDDPDAPDDE